MTQWPFPGDSPVARARKMALAYRAIAKELAPEQAKALDERFRSWGERWHTEEPVTYQPDEWIPTAEAANLINIATGTLSQLRVYGRIKGRLRRGHDRGFEYKVEDVLKLSEEKRARGGKLIWRPPTSTDKVPDNGRSVSDGEDRT